MQVRQLLSSAHYLENSGVRLIGLHFWGSPFSAKRKRRSSNGAFQYSDDFQRTRLWRYVPNDIDVLLTHGGATEVPRGTSSATATPTRKITTTITTTPTKTVRLVGAQQTPGRGPRAIQ